MTRTSSISTVTGRSFLSWLAADDGIPGEIRRELDAEVRGSASAFMGAAISTMIIAAAAAWRMSTTPFLAWAALVFLFGFTRIVMQAKMRRKLGDWDESFERRAMLLPLGWAATSGYGAFIGLMSGDPIVAVLACLSAPVMAAGACFRFCTLPRLAAVMVMLSLGPFAVAALVSGEPAVVLAGLLIPIYGTTLILAARRLNRLLVRGLMSERDVKRRARIDPLTGLLNRAGLAHEIAQLAARDERFALLYLDLDGVNKSDPRHRIDDASLAAFGDRLRALCRTGDVVARIDSDEFVVMSAAGDIFAAQAVGERLIVTLGRTVDPETVPAFAGISIGIAVSPDHGKELGSLLGEADAALYQAKYAGGSRCVIARSGQSQNGSTQPRPPVHAPIPIRQLHRNAA